MLSIENCVFQFVLPNENFRPVLVDFEHTSVWSIPTGDKLNFIEKPEALFWSLTFVNSQPAHFLCVSRDPTDQKFGYIAMVHEILKVRIEAGEQIDIPKQIRNFLLPLLGDLSWHQLTRRRNEING